MNHIFFSIFSLLSLSLIIIPKQIDKSDNDWNKCLINEYKLKCISTNKISSLNGLELYSSILEEIDLTGYRLNDLIILNNFTKLRILNVGGNLIENIDSISKLIQLERLFMQNNLIKSIEALKDLINLTHLDVSNNKLTDVSIIFVVSISSEIIVTFCSLINPSS